MTAREGPRHGTKGVRVLVQMPCRTCHTPIFSRAGERRCLPELSYEMLESTEAMTPNETDGSYRR